MKYREVGETEERIDVERNELKYSVFVTKKAALEAIFRVASKSADFECTLFLQ